MNFWWIAGFALMGFVAVNANSKVLTGQTYKIISAFNHTVLDLTERNPYNGNPVIAYEWKEKETDNQLWIAEEISNGVYVFRSAFNGDFALDSSMKVVGELIVHQVNGGKNQNWIVEPVKPNSFTYYIRNFYHNNRVIELDADRRGVSLNWKDESNPNQHWIFAEKF